MLVGRDRKGRGLDEEDRLDMCGYVYVYYGVCGENNEE